jgi:hypothetical protein
MKCRDCKSDLVQHSTGDSIGIFPRYAYYCNNAECQWAGVLVIANPEEKKQ